MVETINSSTVLENHDHHFRVFAGPGAGKTYWLVNHIRNVVRTSCRITQASYVACISYTNVAVAEINNRLGSASDRVEVSTIHSFLYKNVVKPYLHLLRDASGGPLVNHAQVDGHDEHRPTFSAVKGWLDSVGARLDFSGNRAEIYSYLKKLRWICDEGDGTWVLKPLSWVKPVKYLPTTRLHSYKGFYWREGVIDHDDILYFAYRILNEYPLVCEFLSCRFPYLFVDEFQDTSPVQTQVVKWLAEHHTLVGVIGDPEQSIYGFQGAKAADFTEFELPGHVDYLIDDNRRSTDSIIQLLNHIRGDDVEQKGLRKETGKPVRLYVGDTVKVASRLQSEVLPGDQLIILTRRNEEASRIRRQSSSALDGLWNELERIDNERCHFLEHLIVAGELAILGQYALALAKMVRGIRISKGSIRKPLKLDRSLTPLDRRGLAVSLMHLLVDAHADIRASLLADAYKQVSDHLSATMDGLSLVGMRKGEFQTFAQSATYGMLADALRLPDETRATRTIHQAKSAEFSHVLVAFSDGQQLDHILDPTKKRGVDEAEEKRITYVALSRARDSLSISIPLLSEKEEMELKGLNIKIMRLDST